MPQNPKTCEITCRICREAVKINESPDNIRRWIELPRSERPLIQDAFPNLQDYERELILTATCNSCFEDMFSEEEKE